MGIYEPSQIDLKAIAKKLGIQLIYSKHRNYSYVEDDFKMINIKKGLDPIKEREVFFHELCHILRHEGFQYKMMPLPFRELQERQAKHFTRYAAIPLHMLICLDWKSPNLVQEMSQTFLISEETCKYRVEQIQRNLR